MKTTGLLGLLTGLSSLVQALKHGLDAGQMVRRRTESLEDMVYRRAAAWESGTLVARMPQAPPGMSAAAALSAADPSTVNLGDITTKIAASCNTALGSITEASNEAGFLGCYNVAFFSTTTGVFQADLRLFQLSAATGDFAGVQPNDVDVQLSFPNAAFSIVPKSLTRVKRTNLVPRQATATGLKELQSFWFVGQIDSALKLLQLQDKDLMSLVIPHIALAAQQPDGCRPVTNLTSSSMAFFQAGVFEGQGVSGAAAADPTAAAAAATKAAAFVLPGTTLGIFPIGLIITSIWALIFIGAVGYGTWGRIQFRDQFRQRKGKELAGGQK